MRTLLIISFLLLINSTFGQKKKVEPIKKIQPLSLYNLTGDTSNLLELSKEKLTFIDFWFVPCGPCFAEMNMLHKLYAKYRENSKITFITICLTDTGFVRPLMENRNTDSNQTYNYFKTLAELDTFRLPVYFIKDVVAKQKSLMKAIGSGYDVRGEWVSKDKAKYPNRIFGFSGYPTILIFDKSGQLIYNKTGFTDSSEKQQYLTIKSIIDKYK